MRNKRPTPAANKVSFIIRVDWFTDAVTEHSILSHPGACMQRGDVELNIFQTHTTFL